MWTTLTDDLEPQPKTQGLCEQLQDVVSGTRLNRDTREAQKLEEFIRDISTMKGDDYGWMERVTTSPTLA
jgi:hypothetical protein